MSLKDLEQQPLDEEFQEVSGDQAQQQPGVEANFATYGNAWALVAMEEARLEAEAAAKVVAFPTQDVA